MAQVEPHIAEGEGVPSNTNNPFPDDTRMKQVAVGSVSSGYTWQPQVTRYDPEPNPLAEQIAEATPANADLLVWAGQPKNQPPQSWWDDTTDPFEPEND